MLQFNHTDLLSITRDYFLNILDGFCGIPNDNELSHRTRIGYALIRNLLTQWN